MSGHLKQFWTKHVNISLSDLFMQKKKMAKIVEKIEKQ